MKSRLIWINDIVSTSYILYDDIIIWYINYKNNVTVALSIVSVSWKSDVLCKDHQEVRYWCTRGCAGYYMLDGSVS